MSSLHDCVAGYSLPATVYNRFNRWSRRDFWLRLLAELVGTDAVARSAAIDSTYIKAQRAAFDGKEVTGTGDRPLRGRRTTKIYDVIGRPYALILSRLLTAQAAARARAVPGAMSPKSKVMPGPVPTSKCEASSNVRWSRTPFPAGPLD